MMCTEVLIVGGGPAGATCAWALRRRGIDCLILERATFPRLKLCAGWITPQVLTDLEITPETYPYPMTTVSGLQLSVGGVRLHLPARQLAIRRIEFDAWLLERAGVPVEHHHVREIAERDGGYVVDDAYFGHFLVGAGGTHCPVARTFFQEINPRSRSALIVTQEEEFAVPTIPEGAGQRCHLWFLEDGLPGYAWYVPKAEGIVNVGVGGKVATLETRGDTIQHHWDLLIRRLEKAGLTQDHEFAPKGHAYYLREPVRRLRIDNAFVIGDAAGLATSDMGEGIGPAVRSGLLAANAIAEGEEMVVNRIPRWSQPPLLARFLARRYDAGSTRWSGAAP